ncbi:MAG: YegP family protein [Anaerolineae bacterium]|nr:YegP family protein [Anaerolineae bacterium]
MYDSKSGAENGINSVKVNAPIDERYEKKTSSSKDPYFILKAKNGETIGTSEMYSSTSARDKGIEAVKENAPDAKVEDLTK